MFINSTSTVCITATIMFSVLFILCIILSYDMSKSFQTISKKQTKISVISYLISFGVASLSFIINNIVQYLTLSISTSQTSQLKAIQILSLFTRFVSYCTLYISIAHFLKIKLEQSYQNTFLSINRLFINICFIVYVISAIISIGLFVIVNCFGEYYSNLSNDAFQTALAWATLQFSVILNIYLILILVLFNVKLHKFLALTLENDVRLSLAINSKATNKIIQQTTLMSRIIAASIIFQIMYFIRWIINSNNRDITMYYDLLYAFFLLSSLICIYLTFQVNSHRYALWCKYCHICCIYVCSKTFNAENEIVYVSLPRTSTSKLPMVPRLHSNKSEMPLNQMPVSCNDNASHCSFVDKLCDILQKHGDDIFDVQFIANCNSYKLCDILDTFHHLLEFHDSPHDFEIIYAKLTSAAAIKSIKCDYKNCKIHSRHYARRRPTNNPHLDEQSAQKCILDKIHSFYYHSYDTHLRNTVEERKLNENERVPYMLQMLRSDVDLEEDINDNFSNKFNSSFCIKEHDDNNALYSFGQRFEYYDYNNRWHVAARYATLKEELIGNATCNIPVAIYNSEYEKCAEYVETNRFKVVQHRNENKGLLIHHILSLLIYCNCDTYQNIWSATYRYLANHETDKELKQRHSYFYNLSLYLRELIEDFGQRLIEIDANQTFYHGVNKLMYFTRTMTQFNAPLSTSTEINVALRFSNGVGIVLQLKYASSTYPLNAKFFDCSYFSDYVNEKECLFIGGIPQMIIINIINANNGQLYGKEINALNIINCIFNGTFSKNSNNYICTDKSLALCCYLLCYQLQAKGAGDCGVEEASDNIKDGMSTFYWINSEVSSRYDFELNAIPPYIANLVNEFCVNLKSIMVFWDQISMIQDMQQLLCNYNNKQIFFDLDILLQLFPSLQQIEYCNDTIKDLQFIDEIISRVVKQSTNNNLKYVVIHHKSSALAQLEHISMADWNLYRDSKGIILYQGCSEINRNVLNLRYKQIIQASTSTQMNNNLEAE